MGLLDRRKPPFKGGDSRGARFIPGGPTIFPDLAELPIRERPVVI